MHVSSKRFHFVAGICKYNVGNSTISVNNYNAVWLWSGITWFTVNRHTNYVYKTIIQKQQNHQANNSVGYQNDQFDELSEQMTLFVQCFVFLIHIIHWKDNSPKEKQYLPHLCCDSFLTRLYFRSLSFVFSPSCSSALCLCHDQTVRIFLIRSTTFTFISQSTFAVRTISIFDWL